MAWLKMDMTDWFQSMVVGGLVVSQGILSIFDSHENLGGWMGLSVFSEFVGIGGVSGKLAMSSCGSGILFPKLEIHVPYGCKCREKVACHLSLRKYLDSLGKSWRVHDSGSASFMLFLRRYGCRPVKRIQWSNGMLCSFLFELRCKCSCLKNIRSAVPSGAIIIGPDHEK